MDIYRKNCKKHTGCTHPKLVVLISNRNAEVKPKYANAQPTEPFFGKSTTKSLVDNCFNKIVRIRI